MLASLKSSYDAKRDMLKELSGELVDIGVQADANAEARARARRDELHAALSNNRARRNQLEKQLTFCEAEMDGLQKKLRKLERDYHQLREQVVTAKAGWCAVMRTVKDNGVERRLHRRELAYMDGDELRSMSDKALGALRLAVADNEHLRDVLRLSEDPKRPERKIQFYIAVYQHLRERIRQDIIRTDDPVEAIEQMEIELGRLTEELTAREQKLAISSKSVANIIRKTIQREQNRIRMLNQVCRPFPSAGEECAPERQCARSACHPAGRALRAAGTASGFVQQQPSDLLRSVGQAVSAPESADRHGAAHATDHRRGVAGLPQLRRWKWRYTVAPTAGCVRKAARCLPVKPSVPGCQSR